MYVGFGNNNELSEWAEARNNVHLLANGDTHKYFGTYNWADSKEYFYPEDGDYSKTLRWKLVDELVNRKLTV